MRQYIYQVTFVLSLLLMSMPGCSEETPREETAVNASANTLEKNHLEPVQENENFPVEPEDQLTEDDCIAEAEEQEHFETAFRECLKRNGLDLENEDEYELEEDDSGTEPDDFPEE